MSINRNQPLFWHQGLFLQPHHFQYHDAWIEQTQARMLELTAPWMWGLGALKISETALAARQLVVEQVAVRWRDGALTESPGNALIGALTFELSDFSSGPRTVYIGLRRLEDEQVNVQTYEKLDDASQADARLIVAADPPTVPDRYTAGPAGRVAFMNYVLRLFWDDELENLGQYELLPLVRLEQDGDVIRISPNFVPPCLNLAASPALQQLVRELRDDVIGRARQLEIFKQPMNSRAGNDSQFGPVLALSVLNRYGPQLNGMLETPQTHPWLVYSLLRQLVGELSTFSEYCDLLGETRDGQRLIDTYRHMEIGPSLKGIIDVTRRLLNEITVGPEMLVHFEQDGASSDLFRAEMRPEFFGARHRYYLMARSTLDPLDLGQKMALEAKLGVPDQIETLITRSLPGIEMLPLKTLPLGMPRRAGATYFRLESLSEEWDAVTRAGSLALFLPGAPADLRLELIVIKG
ncbi:type VI secretion system baseplate subunit TssK [Paralcaligenes sp. KSB-10]|uniref:type VI secretion system baseplate subunit TssK n=1 Tax=Paralcaligenes sp. KSB-10 TaxID=2901142 RepID=UPI001E600674|nr:type VI secretion system baseplate subunit TssK [Paralcaligenes sp. KSB-10]UHL65681.1 type VI secretion system baseplate subunit TssK [Paralcaligenes sp. KSB-10]